MYARRQTRPKPRQAQPHKWPAPVAGWVSNRALSEPSSTQGPGAAVLDNFFPRATGVALRRGKALYATLEDETLPVLSLFSYRNGPNEKLFASNAQQIYDISAVPFPSAEALTDESGDVFATQGGDTLGWGSTQGLNVSGVYTGGDWVVVQFATTGGIYLIGVNGQDPGFIYDGNTFYPNVKGGVLRLDYDAQTSNFTAGHTLTGGTSAATGTIWKVIDNGTTGSVLLTGVSGTFQDNELVSDGVGGSATANGVTSTAAPGMDFGSLSSADMAFVWAYKNRLWFAQKDSLDAWYLDVDSIGGTAVVFPLGGLLSNGGSLLFGARWSLEGGVSGGLSDQNVFVSTNGEVAIYQGDNPGDASTWAMVGVYRIGAPLGKRAYLRGGGDLAIATTVGLVPLSKAISLDVTALNFASVSYKISDAWNDAIRLRGNSDWQAMIWSEAKLAAIAPPDLIGSSEPVVFVSNTETGAWCRFTNWHALCFDVYKGQLFFGSPNGKVFQANVSGFDDGQAYSGAVVPLFDDLGASAMSKVGMTGRATTRATTHIVDRVDLLTDYNLTLPPPPDATPLTGSNTWGDAVWGKSVWGAGTPTFINNKWRSIGGMGGKVALCYQVTSGSVAPLDVELVDLDGLFTMTEAMG